MTARDEAIEATADAIWHNNIEHVDLGMSDRYATAAVDAVMPFVVRLAIERGALVKIEVGEDITGIWARDVGGDSFNPDHEMLYRLADQ